MARHDLGLSEEEFMAMAPVALDALVVRLQARERRADHRSASIIAAIFNVHRDTEKRPEPFEAEDFMRDGKRSRTDEDDMKEFVLAAERGEIEPPDPAALAEFKRDLAAMCVGAGG